MEALVNTKPEGHKYKPRKKTETTKSTTSRYSNDPAYREYLKAYMRARYREKHPLKEKAQETPTEPTELKDPNQTRNDKYATDKEYREKVKKQVSERYSKHRQVELNLKNKIEKLLKIINMLL